jgi:hypothetical protein
MRDQRGIEGGVSLFQPDLLLPLQFFAGLRRKAQADGERRLMLAILEDAVDCFQKYAMAKDGRTRQLFADAEQWFLSDDRRWPFSFVNVCEALEIQPQFLRRGLLSWKARQLAQHEPVLSQQKQ